MFFLFVGGVDEFFVQGVEHFLRIGNNATHAAEVAHGNAVANGKSNVFNHLAGVDFNT
jgi:hypothetical protein